jgi:hypothetical protein
MKIEIIEEPIRFHLHGIGGVVENERYAEVGLRLMNEMWRVVKGAGIQRRASTIGSTYPMEECSSALNSEARRRLRFPISLNRLSSSYNGT